MPAKTRPLYSRKHVLIPCAATTSCPRYHIARSPPRHVLNAPLRACYRVTCPSPSHVSTTTSYAHHHLTCPRQRHALTTTVCASHHATCLPPPHVPITTPHAQHHPTCPASPHPPAIIPLVRRHATCPLSHAVPPRVPPQPLRIVPKAKHYLWFRVLLVVRNIHVAQSSLHLLQRDEVITLDGLTRVAIKHVSIG